MAIFLKSWSGLPILNRFLKPGVELTAVPNRGKKLLNHPPKKRHPFWLPKPNRVLYDENLTTENKGFIEEIIESKYGHPEVGLRTGSTLTSPLKVEPIEPNKEWTPRSQRTGVIARKLGIYPLWLKDGTKVWSTLLQVIDNHVIKYIPPEEFKPVKTKRPSKVTRQLGCLVVGAESADPQKFTKEYYGLFSDSGVMPKRMLARFHITADAALQPGTPLYATHFKPGDYVDIRGKTMDRGFQGVMVRWGFKGMPASHGVTKTHRRPGNIGGGSKKANIWKGTKMPGHMGNRARVFRGIKILRINTKYNIMWVLGNHIPGETNSCCYIYDTVLPLKRLKTAPHFPTFLPSIQEEALPEEIITDELHPFTAPTIEFSEQS